MATEIINGLPARPERIFALLNYLRLAPGEVAISEIEKLMMPRSKKASERKILAEVFDYSRKLGLIEINEKKFVNISGKSLNNKSKKVDIILHIRKTVLNAKKESDDNFLLSNFYSWLISRIGLQNGLKLFQSGTELGEDAGVGTSLFRISDDGTVADNASSDTGYGFQYSFSNTPDGALSVENVILPSITPAVFELRNPNLDIYGRVI